MYLCKAPSVLTSDGGAVPGPGPGPGGKGKGKVNGKESGVRRGYGIDCLTWQLAWRPIVQRLACLLISD